MRIIAGSLGGRRFTSPKGNRTHPMSDKGRGALFNALGDIGGLSVLDAFAGSGALSFEAVSRGAARATAIERDRAAQQAVEAGIGMLCLGKEVKLIKANAAGWLKTSDETFDLILLDPPYDDLQPNLLANLAERTVNGGTVVLSLPPDAGFSLPERFERLATKDYGDAQLVFYRKNG
ncbi:MAG: RsmD family RNA methyltransferase [Candidatus Saccharimonadales bacterium]